MVLGDDSMYVQYRVYTCTLIYKSSSACVSSEWGEPGNEASVSCITRYVAVQGGTLTLFWAQL